SIESKAKTARFVDYVHSVPLSQQPLHPGNKLPRPKAPRCLGQQLVVLRHHHVLLRMDVQPELDERTGKFYFTNGALEWGRPFVMNDCILHSAGEFNHSPAPLHAI